MLSQRNRLHTARNSPTPASRARAPDILPRISRVFEWVSEPDSFSHLPRFTGQFSSNPFAAQSWIILSLFLSLNPSKIMSPEKKINEDPDPEMREMRDCKKPNCPTQENSSAFRPSEALLKRAKVFQEKLRASKKSSDEKNPRGKQKSKVKNFHVDM